MEGVQEREEFTLVTRNPYLGLPTACPICLPVYIYLKLARFPFQLDFNSIYPDSDQIPYIEAGTYVAYNNENGGVIERLKQDGIVDLDTGIQSLPEWIAMKAMICSWLADALIYELWVVSDGSTGRDIHYSGLPWPIAKALFIKQTYIVRQHLGVTKDNVEQRGEEIYKKANAAYGALSTRLGEQNFIFEDRPSSLDALFLGHVLFILQALPETSMLRRKLSEHDNLVRYAERLKIEFIEVDSPSSSAPSVPRVPSSSTSKRGSERESKSKPKKEKTEEERTFKRRGRYFLGAQLVVVLLFLSVMSGYDFSGADDDDNIIF